ncbi:MAG TPA: 50S ribosomal protein L6 [bacterium (Candidatus Stahlbacteria)]|nr:50S ribosomal protein L6 [Candidatus Stahlbacteria bacterium]
MSRVGKKPIPIPESVKVNVDNNIIRVEGPKGTIERELHPGVEVLVADNEVRVKTKAEGKFFSSLHGLTRALINNMIVGVTEGYKKVLIVEGMGYKAELQGKNLRLQLGYSHPINFVPPQGIEINLLDPRKIVVKGIDKELVGNVASKIRAFKKPEPYKGKGIRYDNEVVKIKPGKKKAV